MGIKHKLIAAALAAAVAAPVGASATDWIELSQWSYYDVNSYISRGLLADALQDVSDYKQPVTRGQYARLLYAMLDKSNMLLSVPEIDGEPYTDCSDCPEAMLLSDLSVRDGSDEEYRPAETLTRLAAAKMNSSLLSATGVSESHIETFFGIIDDAETQDETPTPEINDIDAVSEDGRDDIETVVKYGVMSTDDSGNFNPDSTVTIEEAVVMCYRMADKFPQLIERDSLKGESVDLGGGIIERITDDYYTICENGSALLELDADVYTNALLGTHNGRRLIFAVNFNDNTDVFDLDTCDILYTIPYIVNEQDSEKGFVYTLSGRYTPAYSGIWSMDGSELVPPKYSRMELDEIEANGFKEVQDTYQASEGWLYYANMDDGGNLYRVDSNGENTQRLTSGHSADNVVWSDGSVFFTDTNDNCLYRMKEDGTELKKISGEGGAITSVCSYVFDPTSYDDDQTIDDPTDFYRHSGDKPYPTTDFKSDGVIYTVTTEEAITHTAKSGKKYCYAGQKLYKYTDDGTSTQLTDFYIYGPVMSGDDDGRLYFTDAQKMCDGGSPLYMYDDKTGEITVISGDYLVCDFGFMPKGSDVSEFDPNKIGFATVSDIKAGEYRIADVASKTVTTAKLTPYAEPTPKAIEQTDTEENIINVTRPEDVSKLYYDDEYSAHIVYNGVDTNLGQAEILGFEGGYLWYTDEITSYMWSDDGLRCLNKSVNVIRYDYKTGEKVTAADNYSTDWDMSKNLRYFSENGCLFGIDGDAIKTAFPNKGLHPYGKVKRIFYMPFMKWNSHYIYKCDTDGNITQLTDCVSKCPTFVPAGSTESVEANPSTVTVTNIYIAKN